MTTKKLIILSALPLIGCTQLMQGQEQPVISKSSKDGIYFTTCSGAVEDWASCNNKAMRICSSGYSALNRIENTTGTKRELTFQCNK